MGHPDALSYPAAKAAYLYGTEWLDQLLVYLDGNRKFLADYIKENIPQIKWYLPEGTYLAWLDCRELSLVSEPSKYFLENAKVALNNGQDFGCGGQGFVRLNFGTQRSVLSQALEQMKTALGVQ